jgi:hypothetical protein
MLCDADSGGPSHSLEIFTSSDSQLEKPASKRVAVFIGFSLDEVGDGSLTGSQENGRGKGSVSNRMRVGTTYSCQCIFFGCIEHSPVSFPRIRKRSSEEDIIATTAYTINCGISRPNPIGGCD